MDREVYIDSIRALEKQIEEGNGDTIELKRTRNSLLNVSTRVPPEILGHIFVWSLGRKEDYSLSTESHFDGLQEGSYNFLLVCHHWFEVASRTPELWGFWGNTLEEWNKWYLHPVVAPLDLVLDGWASDSEFVLSGPLQDALKNRTTQDMIRKIHLRGRHLNLLTSIISSLTPDGERARERRTESIILQFMGMATVTELSDFFTRSRFPKLRYLHIGGVFRISSWDHLPSQTTRLTTLSLQLIPPSLAPTTSQLISTLASNPNLRELALQFHALPGDVDGFSSPLPLRHLETISLAGEFHHVFGLLHRLELPATLDSMSLRARDSTVEDISQTLGPYMREHFRRDKRFQGRLGISFSFSPGFADISVGAVGDRLDETLWPEWNSPFVNFTTNLTGPPAPHPVIGKLHVDLMAFTPQERVVCFGVRSRLKAPEELEELFVAMPNIETLWFYGMTLSRGFLQPNPDGPHANTKLFPSLRSLHLDSIPSNGDWDHLTAYLAHQTSDDQFISLRVSGRSPYLSPGVVSEIKGLVEKFTYDPSEEDTDSEGSLCECGCSGNEEEEDSEEDEDEDEW